SKARRLQEMGRSRGALPILRRLVHYPDLPQTITAEVYHLLGEAFFDLQQFGDARKMFRAALRLEPENPRSYHFLALTIESEAEADAASAARHYQKAIDLAPASAELLADAGAYFVQMGRVDKGLELLHQAVEKAPDDLEILKTFVHSLGDAEQLEEAKRA